MGSGHAVISFVRERGTPIEGVREVVGDVTDSTSLEAAMEGVDAIVHLAASKSDEPDSYEVNVGGMRNLISACKKFGVKRIIYVSTASAKIAHPGIYGATKKEAEDILMESGIPAIILRPSLVYGDGSGGAFGALMMATRLPIIPVFGDGTWISHPIHVDDVARGIDSALTSTAFTGHSYDVGGPDAISFDELLRAISRDANKSTPHLLHLSPWIGVTLARILRLFMHRPPITESNVLGSTQNISWDGEKFFKDSGFVPRTLAEGFRSMVHVSEEKAVMREAELLYAYIYSRSGFKNTPSEEWKKRYGEACTAAGISANPFLTRTPILIGPIDAATKLFYPESALRKRLLFASALVEAAPESAPWLYPRTQNRMTLFLKTMYVSLSLGLKIIAGSFLVLMPGFVKRYAG